MRTISLRTLLRQPRKVKALTRAGNAVQVTDNGEALWILQPATGTAAEEADRRRVMENIFNEVLREPQSAISAARLLEESRR